jgi:hypothetical protein
VEKGQDAAGCGVFVDVEDEESDDEDVEEDELDESLDDEESLEVADEVSADCLPRLSVR